MKPGLIPFLLLWLATQSLPAGAAPPEIPRIQGDTRFRVETVAQGLGVPWAMAFIGNGQLLINERRGRLQRLDLASGTLTPIAGLPEVWHRGQGGLMDIAVPPGYQDGGWIYFTYSKPRGETAVTTLARAQLNKNRLQQWQDLLVTRSASETDRHFGSRITFDGRGHLFFTVGDRGVRDNAQDRSNHAGSVLRLRLDGSLPDDNPFNGQTGMQPHIWSYGHRNPQGISYDAEGQRLWVIEHGPRGGDEINRVLRGANYGWPVVSYGQEYWGPFDVGEGTHREGMEQPLVVYVPSIAPGSLLFYTGNAFPQWRGNLFSGALKLRHLNRIRLDAQGRASGEERLLSELDERIRALAQSPEGWIYLSTDSGRILRLRPSP